MSLRPWLSSLRTLISPRTPSGRRRKDAARAARASGEAPAFRHHVSEPLERRMLLTTITSVAGNPDTIYEFATLPGVLVRMRVTGNISMEVLGASVSGKDNRARIGHLP